MLRAAMRRGALRETPPRAAVLVRIGTLSRSGIGALQHFCGAASSIFQIQIRILLD
jgi:hypothetical protein